MSEEFQTQTKKFRASILEAYDSTSAGRVAAHHGSSPSSCTVHISLTLPNTSHDTLFNPSNHRQFSSKRNQVKCVLYVHQYEDSDHKMYRGTYRGKIFITTENNRQCG